MIDENKLIERLQEYIISSTSGDFAHGLVTAVYVTMNQPKIGGWIPCSERLPEESGFYMVTKKIKETGNRFTGKSRFDIEKGWSDSLNFIDIVAWQPLPEKYHG